MRERRESARAVWRARRGRERPGREAASDASGAASDVPAEGDIAHPLSGDALPLARGLSRPAADELSLVLQARGVAHEVRADGRGWSLLAPRHSYVQAEMELAAYAAENRAGLRELRPLPATRLDVAAAAACLGLLVPFYLLTRAVLPGAGLYPHTWERAGLADAGLILAGQWWRAVTALTLHADAAHLLGNVVVGALFGAVLAAGIGLGSGLLCMVLAGALGNLANAAAHGGEHLSLGFSTAVFGAAGAIAGLRALAGPFSGLRAGFVPVGAGLGLLAMLGSEGERTDLGAHLLGFAAGLALGLLAARLTRRFGPPGRGLDALFGLLALTIPLLAWLVALG